MPVITKKKSTYRRPRQIAVYAPEAVVMQLEMEARRRRRKLGPTVLEILREYFETQARGGPKFADT
ncbi:MAG TPA: hypothetical protein VF772_04575 [Terriglobales bacterium]